MLQAINPKNQKLVNKALEFNMKYDESNDLRDRADDNGDLRSSKKYDALCERYFNRYLEIISDLPKNQVDAIEKFINKNY